MNNIISEKVLLLTILSGLVAILYGYFTGKQILNSVGCYQVELLGPTIIENIKGDFFNVMGFPLFPFLKFIQSQRV